MFNYIQYTIRRPYACRGRSSVYSAYERALTTIIVLTQRFISERGEAVCLRERRHPCFTDLFGDRKWSCLLEGCLSALFSDFRIELNMS